MNPATRKCWQTTYRTRKWLCQKVGCTTYVRLGIADLSTDPFNVIRFSNAGPFSIRHSDAPHRRRKRTGILKMTVNPDFYVGHYCFFVSVI